MAKGHGSAKGHNNKFLDEMRKVLLEKRAEIRGTISHSERNLQSGEGHHLADMEDLASDASDEATAFEILEIERRELDQIERALEALEEGTYGACEECGDSIGKDRLRALPFATMCIDCKREAESRSDDDF